MKLCLMIALLSSSAFAGSIIKSDSGSASWSMNIKNKVGVVKLTRNSTGYKGIDLSTEEKIRVSNILGWFSDLGILKEEAVTFENADERSQETVSNLIKNTLISELSKIDSEIKEADIKFDNLNCQEKGFFKKQLICSADYESRMNIELK